MIKKINNVIRENYCSFELSKELKKHKFNIPHWVYNSEGKLEPFQEIYNEKYFHIDCYYRPTHSLAIKWIKENFNIFLSILCDIGEENIYTYKIYSIENGNERCLFNGNNFNTEYEATENGLTFILVNLINKINLNNNISEQFCSAEIYSKLIKKGFNVTRPTTTHSIAIEWLRINFGLWVEIHTDIDGFNPKIYEIKHGNKFISSGYDIFSTPYDATEFALNFILTKII